MENERWDVSLLAATDRLYCWVALYAAILLLVSRCPALKWTSVEVMLGEGACARKPLHSVASLLEQPLPVRLCGRSPGIIEPIRRTADWWVWEAGVPGAGESLSRPCREIAGEPFAVAGWSLDYPLWGQESAGERHCRCNCTLGLLKAAGGLYQVL